MKKYVSMKMSNTLLRDYQGIVGNCIVFGDSSIEKLVAVLQIFHQTRHSIW